MIDVRSRHGEIANRLSSPSPLVHVEARARDWAVEEIFAGYPKVLNDDRIGRALDAMAPHLDSIVCSIGAQAITVFGVDVARIHWDMTSISLYGAYRMIEDTMVVHGKMRADPVLSLRRVFVWSSARAGAASKARAKKLDRTSDDLERLGRGLGGRYYRTEKQVVERIAVIAKQHRVTACLTTRVGTDAAASKPTLAWHFDQTAIDAEAATDGWYALLTNLPEDIESTAGVFRHYKGQEAPERRFHNFKGPLAVAPMFLKNNRRIEALITIIWLALLVFSLAERAVRLAMGPAVKLAGLWAGRLAKLTGRLIFAALSHLRLVPATDTTTARIPRPPPLQARLLDLLGVDSRQPR